MDRSFWQEISDGKQYPSLTGDINSAITVIGAGILGVTTAYNLAKAGCEVTLVDADSVGNGTTGKNTGKATIQNGAIYSYLASKHSITAAKSYLLLAQKGLDYVRLIGQNCKDLTKQESAWMFSIDDKQARIIEDEFKTCIKLGIPAKLTSDIPINIRVKNAVEIPDQISINPKQYINHLADLAEQAGVRILENTKIIDIKKRDKIVLISDKRHKITTTKVILACHYPMYNRGGLMIPRLTAQRSYIVAGEYDGEYPGGMYISVSNPVRSIRTYEYDSKKMLFIGGAGHRTGKQKEDSYAQLKSYGKRQFGKVDFKYEWSAQDYSTYDLMPFVGKVIGEENIYVATGFNKWGIAAGTGAALSICDLVLNGIFLSQRTFSPKRFSDILTGDFIVGSGTMAKEFVASKIYKTEDHPPKEPGSAVVMNINGKRVGVYRRDDKSLVGVEITCTHVGCGLIFNPLEKSWDCPCHGSRFDIDGNVIDGPAANPLNKVTISFR